MPVITKVVLTGGPCGGKSTALPELATHFKAQGLNVLTIPELATFMYNNGVKLKLEPVEYQVELETQAFRIQRSLEMGFEKLASHSDRDTLLLLDRGVVDLAAYCADEAMWQQVCMACGWWPADVFKLYDLVLHFVTAADGAEAFFTNENNPARNCDPDRARWLDARTYNVWKPHPKLVRIDNSTDFSGKLDRAKVAIHSLVCPVNTMVRLDTMCPKCKKQGNLKAAENEYTCWDCGISYQNPNFE